VFGRLVEFLSRPDSAGVVYRLGHTTLEATDADGALGQGSAFVRIASGAHRRSPSSTWGYYSSCAIPLNSVTRGTIWCAGEYAGSDPLWNTRLFSFRAE
jgi:hypothetical protein